MIIQYIINKIKESKFKDNAFALFFVMEVFEFVLILLLVYLFVK